MANQAATDSTRSESDTDCDVLVIGGGVSGLYAAHKLVTKHKVPGHKIMLVE